MDQGTFIVSGSLALLFWACFFGGPLIGLFGLVLRIPSIKWFGCYIFFAGLALAFVGEMLNLWNV